MKNSEKVNQILSWYQHENNNVQKNIERLLNSGYLGGTGKLVILPVDQGFEHGPSKSFAPNPEAYDPDYHFNFAIEAGCNAYAAPLGFLEHGAKRFSENIKKKIMQNKIGMKETFLYESDSLSYTDNYFKVVLRSQKNKIKSGSLIRAKVISINDGKFQVEV